MEQFLHQFPVAAGHIHYNEPHIFFVGELPQVMPDHLMSSVGQDLNDPAVLWIRQDALKPLSFGIASEFIDGQYFWQFSGRKVDLIDQFGRSRRGHIVILCDILDTSAFLQLFIDLQIHAVGELTVPGQKFDILIESLAASGTDMTTFAKMENRLIPPDRNVSYQLCTIVMDLTGDGSALRAAVQALLHPQMDMHLFSDAFNICHNYIF